MAKLWTSIDRILCVEDILRHSVTCTDHKEMQWNISIALRVLQDAPTVLNANSVEITKARGTHNENS